MVKTLEDLRQGDTVGWRTKHSHVLDLPSLYKLNGAWILLWVDLMHGDRVEQASDVTARKLNINHLNIWAPDWVVDVGNHLVRDIIKPGTKLKEGQVIPPGIYGHHPALPLVSHLVPQGSHHQAGCHQLSDQH